MKRQTKRRRYDTEAEFQKERRKLALDGWIVTDRDLVPGTRLHWGGIDGEPIGVLLLLPLFLLGWLLFRKAPEREIRVRYEPEVAG